MSTTSSNHSASGTPTISSRSTWLWAGIALVVGFVIGFGWQYARAERIGQHADYAARALEAARLEATLSGAVIDAQQEHFELGRQRASDFFSGLQRSLTPTLDAQAMTEARQLLSQRDVVITTIARNDPASASVLGRVLTNYRQIVRHASLDSAVAVPSVR